MSSGAEAPPRRGVVGSTVERRRVFARVHERVFGPVDPVFVGRFGVLERLGSGICGVVYAAHDPKLDRRVALKVLPGAARDEQLGARAEAEAKALARLRHPNVVSVYELGHHEGDRFIAMELVEGETLRAWMDRRPPWRRVVDLFIEAGRGLAAAHAAGVIHRDFKPDNVLVEDGHARVVDFGFARTPSLPTDDESPLPDEAETSTVAGTLAYMAPEAMNGRVGPAGDQFSLCASLYEALYGERPFVGTSMREVEAAIGSGQIRPPPHGARAPRWLWRCLRRGLAADPAERWPDVDALVRHLERKRRRSRAVVIAGSSGLLVGAAGMLALSPSTSGRCDHAGDSIEEVWNDDRRDAIGRAFQGTTLPYADDAWARARLHLDGYADGWAEQRAQACVTAYVLGESSEPHIEQQVRCLDARRAELDALADAFESADQPTVERAVSASRGLRPPRACLEQVRVEAEPAPPPGFVERLAAARVAALVGHYAQAQPAAEALAEDADADAGLGFAADAYEALADLQDRQGHYPQAERSIKASIDRAEQALDPRRRGAAQTFLISVLAQMGETSRAGEWIGLTRATLQAIAAPEKMRADLAFAVGNVRQAEGKWQEAVDARREALELLRGIYGPDHPALASAHFGLGTALSYLGRRREALEHMQTALEQRRSALGERHPLVARAHAGVAGALRELGQFDQAGPHYQAAIELGSATLGARSLFVGRWSVNLGINTAESGRMEQAEPHVRRGVEILAEVLGEDDSEVALARMNLARVLAHIDRSSEALALLLRVEEVYDRTLPPDHSRYITLYANLTEAYVGVDQLDEALASAHRAVDAAKRSFGERHVQVGFTLYELGRVLQARGEHPAAVAVLREAADVYTSVESQPEELAQVLDALAQAHADAGQPQEHEAARARARALRSAAAEAPDSAPP